MANQLKKYPADKIEVQSVKQSLDVLAIDKNAEKLNIKSIENPYVLSLIYSQLLESKSINKLELDEVYSNTSSLRV